jgi:hypothetical protein
MLDTAVDDMGSWSHLAELTTQIDKCGDVADRMTLRVERMKHFMDYLLAVEDEALEAFPEDSSLRMIQRVKEQVMASARIAERKARRYYGQT